MKIEAVLNGDAHELPSDGDVVEVEPGVFSVLTQGRSLEVRLDPGGVDQSSVAHVDGRRVEIEVRDPRKYSRRGAGGAADGPQNIQAQMPGKIVEVMVEAGDSVETGQPLLVVEAMKMQNEVRAPKAGVVAQVLVTPGDAVAAGQAMLRVE